MQGKSFTETHTVEKEATKQLAMTDKLMKELQNKGQVDGDLGILVPKSDEPQPATDVKSEKPSLEKLLSASQKLKPSYLMHGNCFKEVLPMSPSPNHAAWFSQGIVSISWSVHCEGLCCTACQAPDFPMAGLCFTYHAVHW